MIRIYTLSCILASVAVFSQLSKEEYKPIYSRTVNGTELVLKVKKLESDKDDYRTRIGVCGYTPKAAFTNSNGVKSQNICVVKYIDCMNGKTENGETYIVDMYDNDLLHSHDAKMFDQYNDFIYNKVCNF